MITVPACAVCNNGAHSVDEEFRVYLAVTTAYYSDDATRLWRDGAMRTLANNRRLQRELSQNSELVYVLSPNGKLQERRLFRWPMSRYLPVVERIARGLYWHHTGRILGAAAACVCNRLEFLSPEFLALTNDWPTPHVGDNLFRYRYNLDRENPLRSLWVLQFLGVSWAAVETYPVDEQPIAAADAAV